MYTLYITAACFGNSKVNIIRLYARRYEGNNFIYRRWRRSRHYGM